jgi:hypothetical protein
MLAGWNAPATGCQAVLARSHRKVLLFRQAAKPCMAYGRCVLHMFLVYRVSATACQPAAVAKGVLPIKRPFLFQAC